MSAQQAPDFTLEHVKGHQVALSSYRGRPVVIVFSARDSSDQARSISSTIRDRYGADELPILTVLDLHSLPRLVRPVARGQLNKGYEEAVRLATETAQAKGRPMPADPAQHVVMLPDWDGKVTTSFGLSGIDQQAVAVLIDGEGNIRGYGAGAQGGQQVLALFG
jgi:hypothetical protein